MKKILAFSILLAVLVSTFTAVTAVEKLYFADNGDKKIMRCDLDGSNLELLILLGGDPIGDVAIDRVRGKMYWTSWTSGHIRRANLDGSNMETLLTGLGGPLGITVDMPHSKIYWGEFSIDVIRRANLDGSGIEDLVTSGLTHPTGIQLDLPGNKMYWADGSSQYTAKIQRSDLDGSSIETLLEDPLVGPHDIALDLAGGKMYFVDIGTDTLYRSNLDGTGLDELIPSEYGTMPSLCLDLGAGKVYYSDYGAGAKIKRANLDGTGVEDFLSSGIGACYGLTLGPATAECGDASLTDVWMVLVTGVEVYDYQVYMVFDGMGTIDEMGAFSTPDSAGSYAVAADCDMTGYIWSDGYVPFTGHIYSDTLADVDLGGGPFNLIKVMDVGALEGCWEGWFVEDTTGTYTDVSLVVDENGSIVSSSGFGGTVTGKIFLDSGYVAGFWEFGNDLVPNQIMLLDVTAVGDSVMSGTYDEDCSTTCYGGTFYLRKCSETGVGEKTPGNASMAITSYPNPFNPRTTIAYSVRKTGHVTLRVYDAAGRYVTTLVDADETAGDHTAEWAGRDNNGVDVSSGVYFVRFESLGEIRTTKIVLLK